MPYLPHQGHTQIILLECPQQFGKIDTLSINHAKNEVTTGTDQLTQYFLISQKDQMSDNFPNINLTRQKVWLDGIHMMRSIHLHYTAVN